MRTIVTTDSKNRITIPKSVRNKLGIGPRDQLILGVENDTLILMPKPKSYSKNLRGLHRSIWQGVVATSHVKKERDTWEKDKGD